MDRPRIELVTPAGTTYLTASAVIGRGHFARIRLQHPAISEAHALVTLRGDGWWLQALRGQLYLPDGEGVREEDEVPLTVGAEVLLTADRGAALRVGAVTVPSAVWSVVRDGARHELADDEDLRAVFGDDPDAPRWRAGALVGADGSDLADGAVVCGVTLRREARDAVPPTGGGRKLHLYVDGEREYCVIEVPGSPLTTIPNIHGRILYALGWRYARGENTPIHRADLARLVVQKKNPIEKNVGNHMKRLGELAHAVWPKLLREGTATVCLRLGPADAVVDHS